MQMKCENCEHSQVCSLKEMFSNQYEALKSVDIISKEFTVDLSCNHYKPVYDYSLLQSQLTGRLPSRGFGQKTTGVDKGIYPTANNKIF